MTTAVNRTQAMVRALRPTSIGLPQATRTPPRSRRVHSTLEVLEFRAEWQARSDVYIRYQPGRRRYPGSRPDTAAGRAPRAEAFELFDAIGAAGKRLHAWPGEHGKVPEEELTAAEEFLACYLGFP